MKKSDAILVINNQQNDFQKGKKTNNFNNRP
jgi:hypothetical protein